MSVNNIIMDEVLIPPSLPQSRNNIIDESELDQNILVVIVNRHKKFRVGYKIIVYLTSDIFSEPYFITGENIDDLTYQITIPFSKIPLGSYNIFYTITDLLYMETKSGSTPVSIKESASPQTSLEAILMITGYEPVGYEYEILTIQVYDKQKNELIRNTDFQYKLIQPVNIIDVPEIGSNPETRYSMTTNEYGEFKINLKGQKFGHCIIQVTINNLVGNINHTMGEF
ncbi:hypothetical protein [Xenorhabdus griffiniae]|uniref:Uncharacterized protein n=1 Tax=Xenorhabdus griffiniae TaxID=351672 RepID=A0ABY9XKB4_9GAMM|nr:hypothetical protein [Xenorhabdus griffiniae]WMV73380.1 hypothetical protein QL128_04935 [Xenorhabdus griffiniae]WNH03059.1 hypothetical protein QL112_004940 [Xenorhabdus griffiniae]